MKLKQIVLVTGLALVSGQTFAIDTEIYGAGSSAQLPSFDSIFSTGTAGMCAVGSTPLIWYSAINGTSPFGANQRAYRCQLKSQAIGNTTTFRYYAKGGSSNGIFPVLYKGGVFPLPDGKLDYMDITLCGGGLPGIPKSCSEVTPVRVAPVLGLSDVEPPMFRGINVPTTVPPTPDYLPTGYPPLSYLSTNAVMFGVPLSPLAYSAALAATGPGPFPASVANLSRAQVTSMLIGYYGNWNQVTPGLTKTLNDKPVVICRRQPGSGSQAALNAYFPGFPCAVGSTIGTPANLVPADHSLHYTLPVAPGTTVNISSTGSIPTPLNSVNGTIVIENKSTGNVISCMNAAGSLVANSFPDANGVVFNFPAGGSAALGIIGLEKQPILPTDTWKFAKLDDQLADVITASRGEYDFYYESTVNFKTSISAPEKSFVDAFVLAAGHPDNQIPGAAALPSLYSPLGNLAGKVMKGTRAANSCQPSALFY